MESIRGTRVLNVIAAILAALMAVVGVLLCVAGTQTADGAREFVLGCYFVAFGLLALTLEVVKIGEVIRQFPLLDTYAGKGAFWIFWGFLLFNPDGHIGWQILAVVYLACGAVFLITQAFVTTPPLSFMGKDDIRFTETSVRSDVVEG